MISIRLPIKTISEANARGHWSGRARRAKQQRMTARLLVGAALGRRRPALPLVVTLCRLSTGRLDSDNLASALKATRDGVADALGVDDGDERVSWVCKQRLGQRGETGAVEVTVEVGVNSCGGQP